MKLITADGYTLTLCNDGWSDGDLLFDVLEDDAGQAITGNLYTNEYQLAEIRMCEDSEELVIKFNSTHVNATELVDKHFPSFDPENVGVEFHDEFAVWVSMWFQPFEHSTTDEP